ncbi:MAG: hypothetical protein ACRYFA_06775 [Janthinobacterium lividum]
MKFISEAFFVLSLATFAQNSSIKTVRNVSSINISGQQINIKTQNAQARITVYLPSIIRVRVDPKS